MAEFKEVIEKVSKICDEYSACTSKCPLYKHDCPLNVDNNLDELEKVIMNYKLKERK